MFLKRALDFFLLIVLITLLFQSCDNTNDNILSGTVTYIDSISGLEEYADEAFVGLYKDKALTEPVDSMYSDSEGEYLFYPVNIGSYYLNSFININGTLYTGTESVSISMNSNKTQNITLTH